MRAPLFSSSKIMASSGQAFAAWRIAASLSPLGSKTKALNFSSTSKTFGAIEMQLLCPLHLSLSMMIFISTSTETEIHHRRSEEHTSELQSRFDLVCRLLLEKKKKK